MKIKILIIVIIALTLNNCGKVGPLALPEDILDKSIITYPCDSVCLEKFEAHFSQCDQVTYFSFYSPKY